VNTEDKPLFVQSGPPMERGDPAILNARHVQGWNEAIEAAAEAMTKQDCAHGCGVGYEIAAKIRALKI
jgi:hypothetical protein